jgi:hypothetical protein
MYFFSYSADDDGVGIECRELASDTALQNSQKHVGGLDLMIHFAQASTFSS